MGIALRRVARIQRGAGFPHDAQGVAMGDYPFFKVSDFRRRGNDRFLETCENWVTRESALALRAVAVPRGSVLLPKIGAALLGNARRVAARPCMFDNNVLAVVPERVDAGYLYYWLSGVDLAPLANPGPVPSLNDSALLDQVMPNLGRSAQQAVVHYLDTETARIDALIGKKQMLLDLLDERIDAMVSVTIGDSALSDATRPALQIRKLLSKVRRPGLEGPVVTAFRDGQVTARSLRRAEGYTEAWTESAAFQGVRRGDVVVHGLDGFAGAVGTSEADGICSPVYQVMQPRDGGDPDFYGRLLHVLAKTGYLGLFAVSTRERAVDFRNWDLFGRIPIPAVTVNAQRAIGDRLRALRPLRATIKQSEALALERRRALITAAVTGALDIPGVAS